MLVGATVVLDGSGSADANNDPLSFAWSLTGRPASSLATLDDSTAEAPRFIADVPGTYTVSLVVNDGLANSQPSTVAIVAITRQTQITHTLDTANMAINGLNAAVFKNDNLRNTLTTKIAVVINDVGNQAYQGALNKLQNDVLAKLNGCAGGGAPDKDDWITDCQAQGQVYPIIIEAINLLKGLL